jgi:hypothetical protein
MALWAWRCGQDEQTFSISDVAVNTRRTERQSRKLYRRCAKREPNGLPLTGATPTDHPGEFGSNGSAGTVS